MKGAKMSTIVVLALGLMVWSAPMVYAAQYLTVNGQDVDSITLEVRQTCTVEVVSDDSTSYELYVGFVNGRVLGSFSHLQTTVAAGDLADETEYNQPTYYGYHVVADGFFRSPRPGVHFIFEYEAQQVGGTDVLLAELIKGEFVVIDSVHITVTTPPEPMGTAITYQGRLMDANNPADGLYDFEFKLYRDPYRGTQEGNTIDINDLDVIDGQFAVELDFGSDPNIFNGYARWLGIGVRPGDSNDPNAFVTLSPRQELTPTPYAIYAKTAGGDNDWMVSENDMYSIPSGNVGIGTTSPTQKLDVNGSVTASRYYDRSNTSYYVAPASTGTSATFNGNVGIGTANPVHKLDVIDGTMNAEGTQQYTLRVINNGITTGAPYWAGYFKSNAEGASTSYAVYGSAQGASAKNVGGHFAASGGTENFAIWSHTGKNYFAGNVGIGTTNPLSKLSVGGNGIANTGVYGKGGNYGVYAEGDTADVFLGSEMGTISATSSTTSSIKLVSNRSVFIKLDDDDNDNARFTIWNGAGSNLLHVYESGTLFMAHDDGKISTPVLEIRGGSDLSEQFDISSGCGEVKPGMVVCIDAESPCRLVVSSKAYDRTVAGIVSGAGGVKPGMLMGQKGTKADGEHAVALSGRVYVLADATYGTVEPGDLLTTSATPGYAMKAADYMRAQGAILGKAMEKLEKGKKGLILVLVTLQ